MRLSQKIASIRNELESLKVVQPINGGALTKHPATATWTGVIDKEAPISPLSMLAAFMVTFERNDGTMKPPLVQFYYTVNPGYTNNAGTYGAVVAIGADDVSFKIVFASNWWPFEESQTTGIVTITVHALSLAEGNLTIERVYS